MFKINCLLQQYATKLNAQFPNSVRVRRLRGMLLEAQGKWKEADFLYRQILEQDPTDSVRNIYLYICFIW